jgi:hypothetical protein
MLGGGLAGSGGGGTGENSAINRLKYSATESLLGIE